MAEDDYDQIIVRLVAALIPDADFIEHAYDLIRKIGKNRQVVSDLEVAIQQAFSCFEAKCHRSENEDLPVVNLDWRMPDLASEIKKLPENLSIQQIEKSLVDRILDTPGITLDQAQQVAEIFEQCLSNSLGSLSEYTVSVIHSTTQKIQKKLDKIEQEQKKIGLGVDRLEIKIGQMSLSDNHPNPKPSNNSSKFAARGRR